MDNVDLTFDDEVIDFVVDKAIEYKLGARGLRAMDILYKQELEGKVVILDAEKDPDDYLKKYGPQKFEQCLTNALNIIDFKSQ